MHDNQNKIISWIRRDYKVNRFRFIVISVFLVCFSSFCLGLNWESGPSYRKAKLTIPAKGRAGFTSMPITQLGVNFSLTPR